MPETSFFRLWRRPPVYVIYAGHTLRSGLTLASGASGGRPIHVLAQVSGRLQNQIDDLCWATRLMREKRPHMSMTVLAATEEDVEELRRRGVSALQAHHNAFLDERLYYPEADGEKRYDAVHTAQAAAFKRHHLAHAVENLALVTYAGSEGPDAVAPIVQGYPRLSYVNWDPETGVHHLDPDGVRGVVNQARCGLVLSEAEGGNYASAEYLLCGVPLVTTPSIGGRHAFYDPDHVLVVEPTAEAVAAGVAVMNARTLDPWDVRRSVLAKMRDHRLRLAAWLSEVTGEDLLRAADGAGWLPAFRNKLASWREV